MQNYSLEAVENLAARYMEHEGYIDTISDGVLGLGCFVLSAPGKRYAVVTEKFLNNSSSTHTVRFYSKLPKKYEQAIQDYNNSQI